MSVYERIAVDAPPDAVVSALRESLRSRAITEYAVVDHGHDMAAAGAPGFVAWTLVFGNPAAGAKLLEHELAADEVLADKAPSSQIELPIEP